MFWPASALHNNANPNRHSRRSTGTPPRTPDGMRPFDCPDRGQRRIPASWLVEARVETLRQGARLQALPRHRPANPNPRATREPAW